MGWAGPVAHSDNRAGGWGAGSGWATAWESTRPHGPAHGATAALPDHGQTGRAQDRPHQQSQPLPIILVSQHKPTHNATDSNHDCLCLVLCSHQIPACLQDYEGLLSSSNCWLKEAQSWLVEPRTYTTAKCIHCHANSLKVRSKPHTEAVYRSLLVRHTIFYVDVM